VALYENALAQGGETYEVAFGLTDGFRSIGVEAITSDSRIIRILRYAVAPSISQMKLGQMLGRTSVEAVERDRITKGSSLQDLKRLAPRIAAFATTHLDRRRFVWVEGQVPRSHITLAERFAKEWTCSIMADQDAQTRYRSWRKAQQEASVERVLIDSGYIRSGFKGVVESKTDINRGEYCRERRVKGTTVQKADFVIRRKGDGRLVLIEAKAVGVQVDAFKRVKECCDKCRDWSGAGRLGHPIVVAVLAGYFAPSNIEALKLAGLEVVWEHDLDILRGHV
jgi:hypothetical protein